MQRKAPEFSGILRKSVIKVPQAISQASGIIILGKKIKSTLFTTDVAIIRNHNADSILAVYPFTPQPIISQAVIATADVPVFCGVGGGLTSGDRAVEIAIHAEHQGAIGVVLNKPTPNRLIEELKSKLDIPIMITVVSENDDFEGRMLAGVDIFNVSGAQQTANIVRKIREINPDIPIIATGGRDDKNIMDVIEAGANAISWTPPATSELFRTIMERYREEM